MPTGVISSTTPNGRFGFVRLDSPFEESSLAVINGETVGRIDLMNRGQGRLRLGQQVDVTLQSGSLVAKKVASVA